MTEQDTGEGEYIIKQQLEEVRKGPPDYSGHSPLSVAQEVFGFRGFNENGQKEIIDHVLGKDNDALAVMPTGGGKSVCFQIPALIQKNLTVVVSPLIALMQDQTRSLFDKGIHSAFFLNSSLDEETREEILQLLPSGKVKLLYLAPESLHTEKVMNVLKQCKIDLIVIDEAHCISTWGHDFRPAYLKLSGIIHELGDPKILALTATATKEVDRDIQKQLKRDMTVFKASFDRPMLYFAVHEVPDNVDKEAFLLDLLSRLEGPSIVFVRTQIAAENISQMLNENGIHAFYYHAGVDKCLKPKRQQAFMSGECDTVVATIAFGMGIDKSDIRNIVHYNFPQSIEGYYQEVGRAGRDGFKSNCILLFTNSDINRTKALISKDWPDEPKIRDLMKHLKDKSSRHIFTTEKALANETGIKYTPVRLILHRLERSGAIKRYLSVAHILKVKFHKKAPYLAEAFGQDAKRIFESAYIKSIRSKVNLELLADEIEMDYFRIWNIFCELDRKDVIDMTVSQYKDLIYLQPGFERFDTSPLIEEFRRILDNKHKKVDELEQCLYSNKCIRRNILSYFGESYESENCGMCSNCIGHDVVDDVPLKIDENWASDEEIKRLRRLKLRPESEDLHITLLKCIALDKVLLNKDFVKLLQGNLNHQSAAWKFNALSYGILKAEEQAVLEDTLNKLISDELVQVTLEGELRISKNGIAYLREHG